MFFFIFFIFFTCGVNTEYLKEGPRDLEGLHELPSKLKNGKCHYYFTLSINGKITAGNVFVKLFIPALSSKIKTVSYWVSCFTLFWFGMFVYSSPSPRNVSCGCPPTVGPTSPRRHPLAVSLMMFFSQFPTVLRHKQAHSAGPITDKVSQEEGEKKEEKVRGRTVFGCSPDH